jgi:hypothetical protein
MNKNLEQIKNELTGRRLGQPRLAGWQVDILVELIQESYELGWDEGREQLRVDIETGRGTYGNQS